MRTRAALATLVIVIVGIAVVFQSEGPDRRELQREPAMVRSPAHIRVSHAPPKNKLSGIAVWQHLTASDPGRLGSEIHPRRKRRRYPEAAAFGIVRIGRERGYVIKIELEFSESPSRIIASPDKGFVTSCALMPIAGTRVRFG